MSATEHGPSNTLLSDGGLACLITLLLAYFGNDPMRLAVFLGVALAYGILRRKSYPSGPIFSPRRETSLNSRTETPSPEFEDHEDSVRKTALVWLGVLVVVSGFSLLVPTVDIHYFSSPDILNPLTKISSVMTPLFSLIAQAKRVEAIQYFTLALRTLDYGILISLSLFFSVTGSFCLFSLISYHRGGANRAR
jgi:hypothetical protein